MLHEQTHIKRYDHIIKLISFTTLCIHWFNPLVWIAFFLCNNDMEMSCDECVIKKLGNNIKKSYSLSLLSLSTGKNLINSIPLAFGEGNTKSRIKNILNYKKPKLWIMTFSLIALIIVCIGLISNPSLQRWQNKYISQEEAQNIVSKEFSASDFVLFNRTEKIKNDDFFIFDVHDNNIVTNVAIKKSSSKLLILSERDEKWYYQNGDFAYEYNNPITFEEALSKVKSIYPEPFIIEANGNKLAGEHLVFLFNISKKDETTDNVILIDSVEIDKYTGLSYKYFEF